jgi:electron transfer flavoprotein alpha subunit
MLQEKIPEASLAVGLVGSSVGESAGSLFDPRVEAYYSVEGNQFTDSRYATDTLAAEALAQKWGATLILAAGTSRWNRSLPGVAFRLGGRADTHICGLEVEGEKPAAVRWFYRQRMRALFNSETRPWILNLDPGSFAAWRGGAGDVQLTPVEVTLSDDPLRTRIEGYVEPAAGEQTIRPDAEVLFVAGAGWTKVQEDGQIHLDRAERLILDFLKKTNSSLGGSKSMVELAGEGQKVLSFMTHLNQIGQTGSTPRHRKGLATCCHGEEPHTVGWRFIGERRAVNLDPNCGWAQGKADVLYIGDAFSIMEKINRLLDEKS